MKMNNIKKSLVRKSKTKEKTKSKCKDETIIKVLEFLKDQKGHPIRVEKIREHFKNDFAINHYLGLLWPEKETEFIRKAYNEEYCRDYVISEQGLFKLLDYEQLKLTRRISIIAIIIAVISVVATITTSVLQILH